MAGVVPADQDFPEVEGTRSVSSSAQAGASDFRSVSSAVTSDGRSSLTVVHQSPQSERELAVLGEVFPLTVGDELAGRPRRVQHVP